MNFLDIALCMSFQLGATGHNNSH